jgi:hypothetical protein
MPGLAAPWWSRWSEPTTEASMSRNSILGIIGGALIALSVFFTGDSATFSTGALSGGFNIVLFAAGVLVIVFLLLKNRVWASYASVAAATLLIVGLIDGLAAATLGFILLVIGVILAVFATMVGKK